MKFSDALTHYRENAKITKTDLAKQIGVEPTYIFAIEKGRQIPPTHERCEQIARVLKLDDSEKKKFFQLAFDERIGKDSAFTEDGFQSLDKRSPNLHPGISVKAMILDVQKIPVINLKQANQITAGAPFPTVDSHKQFVYSPTRGGPDMFAVKIKDNALEGKVDIDEIVIIDPDEKKLVDGKFYFIRDKKGVEGFVRQIKIYTSKVILHSLNEEFPDIDLDESGKRYEILGRAVCRLADL